MVMRSMVAAAVPYALGGYEVILDFSIPPWFLDTAKRIAGMREVPLEYVVLRPGVEVCAQRARERAEGAIAEYAQYQDLYDDFAGADAVTGDGTPGETARRIREGLEAGRFRLK